MGLRVNCWHCKRTAVAVCRFCGRSVCEDHADTAPFVLDLYTGKAGTTRALVVEDAISCGACSPRPSPVDLPELD